MDQAQRFLQKASSDLSAAAKNIAHPLTSSKESKRRRREQPQHSSSSLHSDIEQTPAATDSERSRRRHSVRERHEKFLSRRLYVGGDSSQHRHQFSSKKWLPRQMAPSPRAAHRIFTGNQLGSSIKGAENEFNDESTPLLRKGQKQLSKHSSSGLSVGRATRRKDSVASSDTSASSTAPPSPPLEKHKQSSPAAKSPHWATIKENIDQGNFLVNNERELLEMDMDGGNGMNSEETFASNKSVETLRQEAIENFQKGSTFSPQLCLLAIALYMVISVFMFCVVLEPQWTVIDSCYFAVSTFTTLGYGDLAPTSTISVVFTTVYALAGVACLGLALGIIGSRLLETKEDSHWHDNLASEYEALTMFEVDGSSYHYDSDSDAGYFEEVSDTSSSSEEAVAIDDLFPSTNSKREASSENEQSDQSPDRSVRFCSSVKEGFSDDNETNVNSNATQAPSSIGGSSFSSKQRERQSAKKIDTRKLYNVSLVRFTVLLAIALAFAFAIGYQSGWKYWDTLYYAVITAATIGYGDLAPHTQEERFLAIFFIPLACAVTGHCLAFFAKWIIEKQGAKYRKQTFASHRELCPEDLKVMDITGDGKVAWFEFLEFMLVAMKKVDPELLDELREYFDRLDVANTGELSKDDLIEMARRKMKSPRRKLELYAYKQHLLELSNRVRTQERSASGIRHWFDKSLDLLGFSSRHVSVSGVSQDPHGTMRHGNMSTVQEGLPER